MGDVYKAMNRSKQEHGPEKQTDNSAKPDASDGPPTSTPPHVPGDPQNPEAHEPAREESAALPLDDVDAVAMVKDLRSAPVVASGQTDHSVADAPPQPPDTASIHDLPAAPAGSGASPHITVPDRSSLNGYNSDIVVHHDRGSVISEQYRAIRLQILSRSRSRSVSTHVITSSSPQEGKSVTSINLGIAFAELGESRTLLLECDLRRPSFQKQFNRDCSPGIVQLLRDEAADIDAITHKTVYDNLDFIPAGDKVTNSTELLQSPRFAEILEKLKGRYDHILIDSPPCIHVTDACILGSLSDDVLMVVRLNKTSVEVVDRAKRLLRAAHCEIAGVVLTHQQFHIPNYLYQYI